MRTVLRYSFAHAVAGDSNAAAANSCRVQTRGPGPCGPLTGAGPPPRAQEEIDKMKAKYGVSGKEGEKGSSKA